MDLSLTHEGHAVIIPGMAYLLRPKTVCKKTGKTYYSKKYAGRWKTASGRWVQKALSEHQRTAKKMLLKLCTSDDEESITHRRLSLANLVEQFHLQIAATATPDYAKMLDHRVRAVIKHIGARTPENIEPSKVTIAVAALADSLRTRNHYQAAIKQFCRWLVDNGHAKRNPVAGLKPAKHEADKRYVRRTLTRDEWDRLVKATVNSGTVFRGLSGQDRLMLYLVTLSTSWRAGGMAMLRVRDFDKSGLVVLEAKYSKNRKEQRKFLPSSISHAVQEYLQDKGINDLVWPGTWSQDAAEMLRIDLEAAGIPHINDDGIMDFHAFRNTSITWMLESGTPIYLVQKHADHANPAQTMKYARPKRGDLDEAIASTFCHTISHNFASQKDVEIVPVSMEHSGKVLIIEKGPREDAK